MTNQELINYYHSCQPTEIQAGLSVLIIAKEKADIESERLTNLIRIMQRRN